MPARKYFIGIDFGTTNSLAAWGLLSPKGNAVTPKVVSFQDDPSGMSVDSLGSAIYFQEGRHYPSVGKQARHEGSETPTRLVSCPKRMLGSGLSFQVDEDSYTPADLCAIVIRRLRLALQHELNAKVSKAVLTVPASLGYLARKDLIDGARLAGLSVDERSLLDEPVAALMTFVDRERRRRISQRTVDLLSGKTLLVVDCGGGTTDATVVHAEGSIMQPARLSVHLLGLSRHAQLGGEDFDELMARQLEERIEKAGKLRLSDLPEESLRVFRAHLKRQAEVLKIDFSALAADAIAEGKEPSKKDKIDCPIWVPERLKPIPLSISYAEFLSAIRPLLDPDGSPSILNPVLTCLDRAGLKTSDVDELLVAGGMSKLAPLRKALERCVGRPCLRVLDPTRSVVHGAVLHHFFQDRGAVSGLPEIPTLSGEEIRLRLRGGGTAVLVPEGAPLPYESVLENAFVTGREGQTSLRFSIGSGPEQEFERNIPLGTAVLRFKEPQPAGRPVTLKISMRDDKMVALDAFMPHDPEMRTVLISENEPLDEATLAKRRETLFPEDADASAPVG